MRTYNAPWKVGLAVLALLGLSLPGAVGIYAALAPARGSVAASAAALGVEAVYLALGMLTLNPRAKRRAGQVILAALITSVLLNAIADYDRRTGGGLESGARFLQTLDGLALGLAVAEAAALGLLSYAVASLLHTLGDAEDAGPAEQESTPARALPAAALPDLALARVESYPAPELVEDVRHGAQIPEPAEDVRNCAQIPELVEDAPDARQESIAPHRCPRCDAPLDRARFLAAKRWGHCASCKGGA